MIYLIECGFGDPAREAEWNAWYNGPKLEQLLSVPDFLSAQRFRALDDRPAPYLNATAIASARMFASADYRGRGGGGFGPWDVELIIDWTRRLFTGVDELPAVPMDMRLAVLDRPREAAPNAPFQWLTGLDWEREAAYRDGIALDSSIPSRGMAAIDPRSAPELAEAFPEVRLYEPICPKRTR
jgi:hypothetical protein